MKTFVSVEHKTREWLNIRPELFTKKCSPSVHISTHPMLLCPLPTVKTYTHNSIHIHVLEYTRTTLMYLSILT